MDLAEGHSAALDCLPAEAPQRLSLTWQLPGTFRPGGRSGHGPASDRSILSTITDYRPDDAAISVADPTKTADCLG